MTDINRRNTVSVFASLAEMRKIQGEQELLVAHLTKLVGDLILRVSKLEDTERERRVAGIGTGPTQP